MRRIIDVNTLERDSDTRVPPAIREASLQLEATRLRDLTDPAWAERHDALIRSVQAARIDAGTAASLARITRADQDTDRIIQSVKSRLIDAETMERMRRTSEEIWGEIKKARDQEQLLVSEHPFSPLHAPVTLRHPLDAGHEETRVLRARGRAFAEGACEVFRLRAPRLMARLQDETTVLQDGPWVGLPATSRQAAMRLRYPPSKQPSGNALRKAAKRAKPGSPLYLLRPNGPARPNGRFCMDAIEEVRRLFDAGTKLAVAEATQVRRTLSANKLASGEQASDQGIKEMGDKLLASRISLFDPD